MEDKEKYKVSADTMIKIPYSDYMELKRTVETLHKLIKNDNTIIDDLSNHIVSKNQENEILKLRIRNCMSVNDILDKRISKLMYKISSLNLALAAKEAAEASSKFSNAMKSCSWGRSFMESLKRWFDLR